MDDSKPLLGKWLEITKHPLKNGCFGFQVIMNQTNGMGNGIDSGSPSYGGSFFYPSGNKHLPYQPPLLKKLFGFPVWWDMFPRFPGGGDTFAKHTKKKYHLTSLTPRISPKISIATQLTERTWFRTSNFFEQRRRGWRGRQKNPRRGSLGGKNRMVSTGRNQCFFLYPDRCAVLLIETWEVSLQIEGSSKSFAPCYEEVLDTPRTTWYLSEKLMYQWGGGVPHLWNTTICLFFFWRSGICGIFEVSQSSQMVKNHPIP